MICTVRGGVATIALPELGLQLVEVRLLFQTVRFDALTQPPHQLLLLAACGQVTCGEVVAQFVTFEALKIEVLRRERIKYACAHGGWAGKDKRQDSQHKVGGSRVGGSGWPEGRNEGTKECGRTGERGGYWSNAG